MQNLIFYIIFIFISKEFLFYDFERVIVLCILTFFIIFYQGTHKTLYDLMLLKSLKLKEEYMSFIELQKKLEIKLEKFLEFFSKNETILINFSNFFSTFFINLIIGLQELKYTLILFLFKINLFSFIKVCIFFFSRKKNLIKLLTSRVMPFFSYSIIKFKIIKLYNKVFKYNIYYFILNKLSRVRLDIKSRKRFGFMVNFNFFFLIKNLLFTQSKIS